jgi:hypothetical protein
LGVTFAGGGFGPSAQSRYGLTPVTELGTPSTVISLNPASANQRATSSGEWIPW